MFYLPHWINVYTCNKIVLTSWQVECHSFYFAISSSNNAVYQLEEEQKNRHPISSSHKKLMEKWYQIILIKFHTPARLQATGNDGFKHKVMMGTFSRDNFYGNHKLLHRKQQQQRRQWQTRASSLEMVRCTSPTTAKHHGWRREGWGWGGEGLMHLQRQKLIYSTQTERNERMKHRNEWWAEEQRSNKEMKEERVRKQQERVKGEREMEWSASYPDNSNDRAILH